MTENDNNKKEIDEISGVETTGHEWDGLKELNNPLPRWWLWIFYICIVWSIGYWVIYPAWPTFSGATKGTANWTQFKKLEQEQAEIAQRQSAYRDKFEKSGFDEIMNDPELYAFAVAGGNSAFKDNCATCHGTGAAGGKGYPNLNDDDWLWGGAVKNIYKTLQFGIRSGHDDEHYSLMLAFGKDGMLNREQIGSVVDYVVALNKDGADETKPGHAIFKANCASCHGADGRGDRKVGAPDLADAIWLYGGDRESVYKTVYYGRGGVMPYWQGRMDEQTIRQLAVYVHSLGGGEESNTDVESSAEQPAAE